MESVDRVLDGVRPYLIADGGNVEVVGVEDGVVALRLQGAPAHASHSNQRGGPFSGLLLSTTPCLSKFRRNESLRWPLAPLRERPHLTLCARCRCVRDVPQQHGHDADGHRGGAQGALWRGAAAGGAGGQAGHRRHARGEANSPCCSVAATESAHLLSAKEIGFLRAGVLLLLPSCSSQWDFEKESSGLLTSCDRVSVGSR